MTTNLKHNRVNLVLLLVALVIIFTISWAVKVRHTSTTLHEQLTDIPASNTGTPAPQASPMNPMATPANAENRGI